MGYTKGMLERYTESMVTDPAQKQELMEFIASIRVSAGMDGGFLVADELNVEGGKLSLEVLIHLQIFQNNFMNFMLGAGEVDIT